MKKIEQILKDSAYKLSQFKQDEISAVEEKIYKKSNDKFYMKCLIRDKEIQLKPEEVIRQLFIYKLIHTYNYPESQIQVEREITFGREKKRADIVIMEKDRLDTEYIIVEVKRPKLKDGKEQLRSYCNATGATMGVWTNGDKISFYHRKDPNYFEDIPNIPKYGQKLKDILIERWTIQKLIEEDKLAKENKSLKDLILEMEDEVLANAGVDVFEEVFKLIYIKLYDEKMSANDKARFLEFRNYGETDAELKETIQIIFDKAKTKWAGVFVKEDKIKLTPSHLSICVSSLQNVKLFNSNLEVIDEAFEYLMNKSQKGEKGQYFTPRYVIDMCVKMLNPKENEFMIDTAAGSCGFPVHTIFHVWKNYGDSELFTAENKPPQFAEYVQEKIFAIDFDEKAVRVARTLNLIAGDGKTNVLWLNTLDYERWSEYIDDEDWEKIYLEGWAKLLKLRAVKKDNRDFNFDIVMANPPFAGDIKETRILHKYELSKKSDGKYQTKMSRDVLFIERNLQFLKPGGRMAIVLPQGRFNNSSDKYIRDFIAERCRILAVVGLHGNVFKPHTGTKTSVLFVQKWDDKLCPRRDDYKIFFATMQKPSKDNSGEKIYVANKDGSPLRDKHNHLIVDHDLFNHEGLTADGIAEAFKLFAMQENLSFFDSSSFNEKHYKNLLEGLECTEIFLSEVLKAEKTFRLDAEFFKKDYVKLFAKLNSMNKKFLRDYAKKIDVGFVGNMVNEYTENNSAPILLQTKNISEFEVNLSDVVHINENFHSKLKKSQVHFKDILIARSGSFGKASIWLKNFVANSADIIIVKADENLINPYYLVAFLNSFYGREQLFKFASGGLQGHVNLTILENLIVPNFSKDFQIAVEKVVKLAHKNFETADEVYKSAEKIFAQALQLEDFKPSAKNTAEVSFSSFMNSGRLDAEFFMPKYDDAKNFMNVAGTVKNLCNVGDKNFLPKSEEIYSYIELANVGTSGNISTPDKIIGKELPTRARQIVKAGQVIISSIEGSLQSCALITAENDNAICSTGFFVVDSENYNAATLLILFKSKIMQMLMKQNCSGTILTAISRENFLNLPLPIIDAETQGKIAALVEKSFNLRAESERLLEVAKLAVEIAIERGEDVAIKFLNRGEKIGD